MKNWKKWKKAVNNRRMLALLLTVVMLVPSGHGLIARANSKTAEEQTETTTKDAERATIRKTMIWDFENESQLSDFSLYQSGTDGFTIQNGVLVPSGADGEMKAIVSADIENIKTVSVDVLPGKSGTINGALYVGSSNVGTAENEIDALAFLLESFFSGWPDAPNRVDLVTVTYPNVTVLEREIFETGSGNALFRNGNKEPLNLKLVFGENIVVVTVSLVSDSSRCVQTMYELDSAMFDGKIGLRANGEDICYDNLTIEYEKELSETSVWDFSSASQLSDFKLHQSEENGYVIQDGKLVSTDAVGEEIAILDTDINNMKSVSVDIIPGASGKINAGMYLESADKEDNNGLSFFVESHFTGSEDAANRIEINGSYLPEESLQSGITFTGVNEPLVQTNSSISQIPNTIEMWVKMNPRENVVVGGVEKRLNQPLISSVNPGGPWSATSGDFALFTDENGSLWWFEKTEATAAADPGFPFVYHNLGTANLWTGEWMHVAVSRQQGNMQFYINGEKVAEINDAKVGHSATPQNPVIFGHSPVNNDDIRQNNLDGSIGDVRLWSKTRTQDEILLDMNKDITGTEKRLMHYWKFDDQDSTIFTDSVPNGINGKNNIPNLKSGITFTGVNEPLVQTNSSISQIPNTIEMWVKMNPRENVVVGGVEKRLNQPLISSVNPGGPWSATSGDFALFTDENGSLWWFEKTEATAAADPGFPFVYHNLGTANLWTGEWMHVAVSRQQGNMQFYINGEKVAEINDAKVGHSATPQNPVIFGHSPVNNDDIRQNNLDGSIGDVRLWSSTRTQDAIRQDMNKNIAGTEAGLMHYWKFDDQGGTTFKDSVPNGLNGVITDASKVIYSIPNTPAMEGYVSDTSNGNALFKNGQKEPLNFKLEFGTDTITATLSLISDPSKYVQHTFSPNSIVLDGKIWLSARNSDVSFDNFKIEYECDSATEVKYINEGYNFWDKNIWQSVKALNATPNTIEAWVKVPEGISDTKTAMIISNKDNQPTFSMEVYTKGRPRLYWQPDNQPAVDFVADVDLRTGEWTHVAFVCNVEKDKVSCYINGESVYTKENAGLEELEAPVNTSVEQHFYVGNTIDGTRNDKFMGWIADARIWETPLSETEVKDSMMTQYTSEKEGLIFNVRFDQLADGMFTDLSDNENHIEVYERELNWIEDTSEPGDYSIIVIPDQQVLSAYYPDKLNQLYQWIADNAEEENIQMVMNLGDIVDDCGNITMWERAKAAYEILPDDLPFIAVPGNHDYDQNSDWGTGVSNRNGLTIMNQYFPMSLFEGFSTESGSFSEDKGLADNVANTWQSFNIYGNKYMIVALEYNPAEDVLEWASDVVEAHPEHQVIVITHNNLYPDGTLTDAGAVTWEKFTRKHENIIMVLSGHESADNIVRRMDQGENGNDVVQMLLDAQTMDSQFGGLGMLGIMRFTEEGTKCDVSWYSPLKDQCLNESNNFTLTLPKQNVDYTPTPTDKTELNKVIQEAESLNEADYRMVSWKPFAEKLEMAKEVAANDKARQHIINARTEELKDAIDALISLGEHGEEALYTFEDEKEAEDFNFYHSSNGGFAIEDGKLVTTGEALTGEFKAILEKKARKYKSVSVDILPNENGYNVGLFIGASNAEHAFCSIDALGICVTSNFTGWEDAANRVDLVVGSFPVWAELSKTISETGNGNNLFTNGEKKPLTLKVDIDGNIVTITLSLRDNPNTYIQTVYQYTGENELADGYIGLRSVFGESAFDNLYLYYDQYKDDTELKQLVAEMDALKAVDYSEQTWNNLQEALTTAKKVLNDEKSTQNEVEAAIKALKAAEAALELSDIFITETYTFEDLKEILDFDFYRSSLGEFVVKDGKLVASGEYGDFKGILKGTNRAYKSVSVELYPGEDDNIRSGLYIHGAGFGHAQDNGHALYIGIESFFTGWEDAANRVDIIVGSIPEYKELSRTISETGAGNALYTNGNKEPLKLKVDIKEKEIVITVSLLSNPNKFVQTVYEYTGDGNLMHGRVGVRSLYTTGSLDNFEVLYKPEVYSEEEITGTTMPDVEADNNVNTETSSPDTGDNMGTMMVMAVVMAIVSSGIIVYVIIRKRRYM